MQIRITSWIRQLLLITFYYEIIPFNRFSLLRSEYEDA